MANLAFILAMAGGGALVLIATVASVIRIRHAVWLIAVMLFLASIAVAFDYWGIAQPTWLFRLQQYRSEAYTALGTVLGLVCLTHVSRVRQRGVSIQGFLLLVIALYAGFVGMFQEDPFGGVKTTALVLVTMAPLLYACGMLLEDWEDFIRLLRAIALTNWLWILACLVQIGIDRSEMIVGNEFRFVGMTANPQHAATLLGILSTVSLWLILSDPHARYRPLWMGALAANLVLIVWTGSRTGMGMLVVGATMVLYNRFGRAVLLMPLAALVAYVAFKVAGAADVDLSGSGRLTSTENTRRIVWLNLLRTGIEHPIFGVGRSQTGDTENSYLYGFAAYGFGMLLALLLFTFASLLQMVRVRLARPFIPERYRPLVNMILAFNAMFFAGAIFEGYMIARVNATLSMMVIFGAMASRLVQKARQEAWAWTPAPETDWHAGETTADRDEGDRSGAALPAPA